MTSQDLRAAIVLTTFDTEERAAAFARQMVEERLAACGTILGGARSIYIWNGNIDDAREWVLLLKTIPGKTATLASRIRELHTYSTPEILVWNVDSANPDYDRWLREHCEPGRPIES
ncbi:MAG: divalent-cation tolerance protein CutA [Planctomycetota bacterium]